MTLTIIALLMSWPTYAVVSLWIASGLVIQGNVEAPRERGIFWRETL